jgi:hypothetical protein
MPESTSTDRRNTGPLFVLRHGLRALDASAAERRADIERVEAFWSFEGQDHCSGGFVLNLNGGHRAYLDVWVELAEDERVDPVKIDIEFTALPADQKYPRFPSTSDPVGGWHHDVDFLNDCLRL